MLFENFMKEYFIGDGDFIGELQNYVILYDEGKLEKYILIFGFIFRMGDFLFG